jgi:predicted secreted protein
VIKVTNSGISYGGNNDYSFVFPQMGMTDGTNDGGGTAYMMTAENSNNVDGSNDTGHQSGPVWMSDTFGLVVAEHGDSGTIVAAYSGVRVE